jgi:hypothetical protein
MRWMSLPTLAQLFYVHKEFVPPGQTANGKFYCEVLKQLREGIQCKLPDIWKNN